MLAKDKPRSSRSPDGSSHPREAQAATRGVPEVPAVQRSNAPPRPGHAGQRAAPPHETDGHLTAQRRAVAADLARLPKYDGPLEDWTNAAFRPDLYQKPVLPEHLAAGGGGIGGTASVQRKMPGASQSSMRAEPTIAGPLGPGELRTSGAVTVKQVSEHSAVIRLGKSRITIDGTGKQGSAYSFHVDAGRGTGQRVVRVFATADIAIREEHDPDGAQQLICHRWTVSSPKLADARPTMLTGAQAADSDSDIVTRVDSKDGKLVAVNLSLDGSGIDIRADEPGAAFSYVIDDRWSAADSRERVVTVVATPGVSIAQRAEDAHAARQIEAPGRTLVPRIVRVNTAGDVPGHDRTGRSTKSIDIGEHVRIRRHLGTNPQEPKSSLVETRGGQGVTIRESTTGAWMQIRPKDARIGGAYAYEIVRPPLDKGGATEIRALVGPGMIVEVLEPGPDRSRLGGVPDPGLAEMNVRMVLYRTEDPAAVPVQGTRLTDELLQGRGQESKPDQVTRRALTPAETAALTVTDTVMGAVPGAGEVTDLIELGYASITGKDRYGRKVSPVELAIMGVAVLIPFVGQGALRGALRLGKGAEGTRSLPEIAAHFGRTEVEMEALLVQVSELTPQDVRAVRRVEAALREGKVPDAEDVKHVRESLEHLGFSMDAPMKDIAIYPDTLPAYDRVLAEKSRAVEDVGSTIEVGAVRAGASGPQRHHVLPQEHRTWFEERGFTGENSIDNYCVELERDMHEAIHGGGDYRLARQAWPGEWNRMIMARLWLREKNARRRLTAEEILTIVRDAMIEYEIDQPFVDYSRRSHR